MTETIKKATAEKSDTAQAPAPQTIEEEDLFEDFPLEEGDLPALVISCVLCVTLHPGVLAVFS